MRTRLSPSHRPLGISLARFSSSLAVAAALSLAGSGRLHADAITLNGNTLPLAPVFTAPAANTGFAGFYYNNVLFGAQGGVIGGIDIGLLPVTAVRNDALISFDFTQPAQRPPGVGPDNLGVVWTNVLNITNGGDYIFATTSDDGSLLYVDGTQVVQNDFAQGATRRQGMITLAPGFHTVITKLGEGVGGVNILANYAGPDTGGADVLIGSVANTVSNTGTGTMIMGTLTLATDVTLTAATTSTIDVAAATVTNSGTVIYEANAGLKITGITGSETFTQTGAVTLNGSNLLQVGTFGIQQNASTGIDVTISGNIGEAVAGSSLIKSGSRTLTLSGANTYTGPTTVAVGTLKIGSVGAMAPTSVVTLGQNDGNNATLDLNGFNQTIGGLATNPGTGVTGTKQVLNAGAAVNFTVNQATNTSYGGVFTGNLNLTKTGNGTLLITGGASGFTGAISVTGGTLGFNNDNQLGAASNSITLNGGTLSQTLNGSVQLGGGRTITVGASGGGLDVANVNPGKLFLTAGQILGAGQLTKSGAGILQLTGPNTFTGNWVTTGGQIEVQNAGALGPGTITLKGGELVTSSLPIANPLVTALGGGVLSFDNGGTGDFQGTLAAGTNFSVGMKDFYQNVARNGTISGVISGPGMMTVNAAPSAAELSLTGNNTAWTGGITIGTNVRVRASQGPTFDTLGSGAVTLSGGTLAISPVVSAGATAGFHGRYYNSPLITNGVIGGFDFGLLDPVGTRADLLIDFPYTTGPNFSPIPPVPGLGNQNVGVLWTGVINILAAGSYTFTTGSDDGSLLYIDGAQTVQNDFAQGTTERSGTITLTAGLHPMIVKFANGGGPGGVIADYAGPDTGGGRARIGSIAGTLTNTGSAILGSLTMDNAITLSAGLNSTIDLAATTATNTGTMTFQAGSGLTLTGVTGYDTLTQNGIVTLNGSSTITLGINQVAGNIQNASAGADFVISGAIGEGAAGSGLTKVGPRLLTISGSSGNTFTGALIDNQGVVLLAKTSGNAVGTGGVVLNGNGSAGTDTALVRLLGDNQIADSGPVTITTVGDSGARFDLNGFVDTIGALTITSTTSNLAIMSAGPGTGALTVTGSIVLNNNRPAANNTGREVLITSTGNYGTPVPDEGGLNLGGTLRNITVETTNVGANIPGSNATIETAIVNGGINKLGSRTLILNSFNSYAGGTVINSGAVRATGSNGASSAALGSGLVTLKGGSLELRNNGVGNNGTITYGNGVIIDASQTSANIDVNNNGANTGNTMAMGNLSIGAQTLNVTGGNSYALRFASGTLTGNAAVNLLGVNLTLNNVGESGGSFSLTKAATSTGLLTLTGNSTYTGGTSVPAGTLRLIPTIGTTNKPAGTGAISIGNGGTLQITPTIASITGAGATQGSLSARFYNGAQTISTGEYYGIPTAVMPVSILADGTFFNRPPVLTPATATNLLAVYSGLLRITAPGSYSFQTAVQDQSQLVIDGVPVISVNVAGGSQPLTDSAVSAPITLSAGFHTIAMKVFNGNAGGGFRVRYQGPDTGDGLQVIAPAALYAPPALLNVGNTGSALALTAAFTVTVDGVGSDLDSSIATLTLGAGSTLNVINTGAGSGGGSGVLAVTGTTTLQGAATLNPTTGLLNLVGVVADGGGNFALTKTGSGTVVFGGVNTFGGALAINAGGVQVTNAASLGGTASGTTVGAGATLDLNGAALGAEPLTLNGTGYLASAGALYNSSATAASASGPITINAAGTQLGGFGDITLGGIVSGSAANTFSKIGGGTLTLNGANSFAGVFTISQGVVKLGDDSALGATSANTIVTSGTTLDLNGRAIAEPLTLSGTGFTNTSGANMLAALINTSGTAASTSAAITLAAATTIGSNSLTGGGNITIGGVISGAFALTKVGGNTLTLTAANTYTGVGTVQFGTLILSGAGTLAESQMFVNPAATLTLDDTGTNNTANSRLGTSKILNLLGANFNILGNAGANTVENLGSQLRIDTHHSVITLTPGAGRNVKLSAGSLARSNTTAKGTALFRGTGLGTLPIDTAGIASITFTTAPAVTGQAGAAGTKNRGIVPWAVVDTTTTGPGSSFAAYSAANGLQALQTGEFDTTIVATSNIVASSAITAPTGSTTINSLTLNPGGGLAIGSGRTIVLESGGILATATASISGAGTLSTTSNREVIIHTAGAGTNLTIATPILGITLGAGVLTKAGDGTLTLSSNASSYVGTVRLNGGTTVLAGGANTLPFAVTAPPAVGSSASTLNTSGLIVDVGATLDLAGNDQRIGEFSNNAVLGSTSLPGTSGMITNSSGTPATFRVGTSGSGNSIIPTILAGNLNFQRDGSNSRIVTSPWTYTGTTMLTGGILTLQDQGGLINTSSVAIRRAALKLDDSQLQAATRIKATAPIGMDGGAILFVSRSGGTQDVLPLGPMTLNTGASLIATTVGGTTTTATGTATINIASLARSQGATINFTAVSNNNVQLGDNPRVLLGTGTPTLTNGIVGGWATTIGFNSANPTSGSASIDFATYDPVTGFRPIAYTGIFDLGNNVNIEPNNAGAATASVPGGGTTINSLRIGGTGTTTSTTLIFTTGSDLLNLQSGGLLSTGFATARSIGDTANSGKLTAGGTASGGTSELFIHSGASNVLNPNVLTINSQIVNNPSGAQVALVLDAVSQASTIQLNGSNTYTGTTYANGVNVILNSGSGPAIPGNLIISGGTSNGGGSQTAANQTVTLLANNQIAPGANVTINGGGALNLGGFTNTVNNLNFAADGGSAGNIGPSVQTGAGTLTVSGSIAVTSSLSATTIPFMSGNLALSSGVHDVNIASVAGAPTQVGLEMNSVVSGPGSLNVASGVLGLGSSVSTVPVGVAAGATLTVSNFTPTIGALTGAGTVTATAAPGQLTVGNNNGSGIFSGTITGPIAIVKTGSGTQTINNTQTYPSLTVNAGAVTLGGRHTLSALTIGTGTQVMVTAHTGGAANIIPIDTSALTISGTGALNLTNNAMVVRGGSLSAITGQLLTGRNAGAWNGAGINSSTAANDLSFITAVGVIDNSVTNLASFAGVTGLTGAEILVKYTYYGDANLDGQVTGADYSQIDNGFANSLTGWFNGDFNYDGVVTGADYSLIDNGFANQGAQLRPPGDAFGSELLTLADPMVVSSGGQAPAAQAVVPEPGSIALLAAGAVGLLSRRRRSQRTS